jgi:hypothetical protein
MASVGTHSALGFADHHDMGPGIAAESPPRTFRRGGARSAARHAAAVTGRSARFADCLIDPDMRACALVGDDEHRWSNAVAGTAVAS